MKTAKLLALLSGILLLTLSACTAGAPAASSNRGPTAAAVPQKITAAQLKSMLEKKDFLFVNVHVPYDGQIERTDLFVPYDQIEQKLGEFPSEKRAEIVLYCRSGNMSGIAARRLASLGYSDVFDLDGGMLAWQAAGYPLISAPG